MDNQMTGSVIRDDQENYFGLTFLRVLRVIIRRNNLSDLFFGGYTHTEHLGQGSRKVRTMANRLMNHPDQPSIQISASDFLLKDFEEEILPKIKREIGYDFMALSVPSIFLSGEGEKVYFPMLDFEAPRTLPESQEFIKDLLSATAQDGFVLASSAEGLHFVGEKISTEEDWRKFTLTVLLSHDCNEKASIDLRWLVHRLRAGDGQTRLRVWYDEEKIGPFKKGWREPVVIARMKDGIFHTKPEFWLPGGLSSLPVK